MSRPRASVRGKIGERVLDLLIINTLAWIRSLCVHRANSVSNAGKETGKIAAGSNSGFSRISNGYYTSDFCEIIELKES